MIFNDLIQLVDQKNGMFIALLNLTHLFLKGLLLFVLFVIRACIEQMSKELMKKITVICFYQ